MEKSIVFEEVHVEKLRWRCPTEYLTFETTDDIEPAKEIVGQERALQAIKLGLAVDREGYNIFVTGLTGPDRISIIERLLNQTKDQDGASPDDVCCVHNFKDPDLPKIVLLPAGKGASLKHDIKELIESLKIEIPQIFESDEYKSRRKAITEGFRDKQKNAIKEFEKRVTSENFTIVQLQMGPYTKPAILPVVMEKPLPLEQVEALVDKGEYPRETYERLKQKQAEFTAEMENLFADLQKKEKDFESKMKSLDKELVLPLLNESIEFLKQKYNQGKLNEYLEQFMNDLLDKFPIFLPKPEKEGAAPVAPTPDMLTEYEVNLLVDNSETIGKPIIVEKNPTYRNLFGGIEKMLDPRYGVWRTDFTKIKAGSLLRANGGFLALNFLDAVMEPGVWQTLKRVLKNRSIEVQSFDPLYFFTMSTLKPEPIELNVKVLLVGDNRLYYLLHSLDEDFRDIFKIKADFDSVLPNEEATIRQYLSFIKNVCDEKKLLPVDRGGVASLIEYGVRVAGRQKKITAHLYQLHDILSESQFWATEEKASCIAERHVDTAIENREYRVNLIETKIQEMIEDGIIMIDTEGMVVGQVNGLSVYDLGDYSFGKPSRITAKTSIGRAGIINIEREADLSGKTHNKGVLILSGYLRYKYAQNRPLAMSASLCFEQSYGGVDGDSASSTEVYALLSSLSNLPLRQDIAVTGSVNQKGEIQPIGGVNQKIEGFFDVCRAKGLTGTQGVIIPHQNRADLMLRKDVVTSVAENGFHIYPIKTIDEGVELLTGIPAGENKGDNTYPEGTVNFLVDQKLQLLAERLKDFGSEEKEPSSADKDKSASSLS
ncbi:MAG: AAA family ATPase [Deltaproteobacteria bacterium]|nr:AAA family ATPase [Deltaproteobacteria bacterium]